MDQKQTPFPGQPMPGQNPFPGGSNPVPPIRQNVNPYMGGQNPNMPPMGNPMNGFQPVPQGMPGQMPPNQPMPVQGKVSGKNKKASKKGGKKKFVTLGIFGGIGLVIGIIVFLIANKYFKQLTVINLPGAPVINDTGRQVVDINNDGVIDESEAASEIDLASMTDQSKLNGWDGNTRVTCLAMGLDARDLANGEKETAPRSDSMMLLTYDPVTGHAGMLSIPRDTWVMIPDHGYGRINTAYSMGEGEQLPGVNGKPGGGPGLAMRTVEAFLGIDIQYYAVIDFQGFVDFIDVIDKLAINVRDDITLGEENGVPIFLYAGVQDLDGKTALAYARYRYTEGGDFERAQRQQDVIFALYEQMVWQLPELLTTKADQVFACIQKAVKTNIPMNDLIKFAWTATGINSWFIDRGVISPPNQVEYGQSVDGQQILIPIPDRIRETRDAIFKRNSSGAQITDDYTKEDRIRDEAARVTVMNGSSVAGIAEQTISYLQGMGINVVSVGQGSGGNNCSLTIKTGKPYTAQFFVDTMRIPTTSISLDYDPNADADLILNITDDWAYDNPMGQ